ncbi:Phosphoribosylpyrophosphate synthetase, partial [Snodgrassella alvi SCGC AB-598-O02]
IDKAIDESLRCTDILLSDGIDVAMNKLHQRANEAEVMNIIGDVADRDCILVDDMIDTAGTLCKAADALKARGLRYGVKLKNTSCFITAQSRLLHV